MDYIGNRIYVSTKYDKFFQDLKTSQEIFCIYERNEQYFITDVYGKLIIDHGFEKNNNEVFNFKQKHFCKVLDINRKNDYVVIEVSSIDEVKLGINNLYLKLNKQNKEHFTMKIIGDDSKAIILAINKVSETKERIAIIVPETGVGYYVKVENETSEKTNYIKKKYLVIDKKIHRFEPEDYCFVLFVGKISIGEEIEYMNAKESYAIEGFSNDITNYVNLWNKYNDAERELTFMSLKGTNPIRFSSFTNDSRLKLYFDEENFRRFEAIKDDVLLIGNLQVKELSKVADFQEYVSLEKEMITNEAMTYATVETLINAEKVAIVNVKNIKVFENFKTDYGYITSSLQGTATMFRRRENARKTIITPNPGHLNLRTFFTDKPVPNELKKDIPINYNLVKDVRLTENQKEAIEIICNTPDIAIIQGPPGTGKTTVINQAITQINAYSEKISKRAAKNLVSGFRHETVSNLTDKIKLYGLPAIKIGEKKSDNADRLEPKIDKYIEELNDKLDEKYHDLIVEDKDYEEFSKLYNNYRLFYNSIDSTIELLENIKKLEFFKFNVAVCTKIDELVSSLQKDSHTTNLDISNFLDILYKLPLYEEAYKDDISNLEIDIELLNEISDKELKSDIQAISLLLNTKPLNFELIKAKRRELIIKYRKTPEIFTSIHQKKDVLDYLDKLFETIKIERLKKYDGEKVAILDYKNSLYENPFLIRQTLLEYTKVLGATNQQSMSYNMFLTGSSSEKYISFDNVFIDEAATSSPLDLFIPMTLAKERLVLVGDHKQLPHIINEKITRQIEEDLRQSKKEDVDIKKDFEITLFEYLIEVAKKLEAEDGKRRVITLNSQFRMHPLLGDIVSKYFYDDNLKSPRPASEFTHNYHNLSNKCLIWLDNKGKNKKVEGSRNNVEEAEIIAKHIREAIEDGSYNYESIAVITFYKKQVDMLKEIFKKYGLLDQDGKPRDKLDLSIGTVDAFQGREFQIVYLATTYSSEHNNRSFQNCRLNNDNLLCVALSRQINLLIVVGNRDDYRESNALKYVPSLHEINRICNGD